MKLLSRFLDHLPELAFFALAIGAVIQGRSDWVFELLSLGILAAIYREVTEHRREARAARARDMERAP